MQTHRCHQRTSVPRARVPCAVPAVQRAVRRVARRYAVTVVANDKVAAKLEEAKRKYESGDRMSALKVYEDVLEMDSTQRQKQAAYFGQTAVHASFGDVEFAQITLREGIQQGLDFEQALEDPDVPSITTSPQILLQLKKFNQQFKTMVANRAADRKSRAMSAPSSGAPPPKRGGSILDQDLDKMIGSATSDEAEVDASIPAIIKRVAALLLTMFALFGIFFFVGLYYFPE